MGRNIGSRDIGKRKQRSDKGKLHKTYGGKILPKKRAKKIKFNSQRGHKTHLKLWVWKREPMSTQGLQNWKPRLRGKVRKTIFKWGDRLDVEVERLVDIITIEQWALDSIMKVGDFYIMGCTGSPKTKTGVKWTKLFRVRITESEEGLTARVIKLFAIYRYWFWKGGRK